MQSIQRVSRYSLIAAAAIILAACSGQKDPAQKLIGDIDATVAAASPEAAKYVPDQLADVQSKLGGLKASFDKQDYAAVVAGAPAVLNSAQTLATAAAAKKDEILKALNDDWIGLAASVPENVTAIQSRIDLLSKKSSKKMAAGIDLNAAKVSRADAQSLWSKAQAAFAAGNLEEAVSTAKDVKTKTDALAASLKLDLPAPAQAPAGAPPSAAPQ
jgi:PBP1b-binding outer membrane lipoprotein LpoB